VTGQLTPHELELVHRYFDGELSADEVMVVEDLLQDEPAARRVLDDLRGLERSVRNEALSAAFREDFSDWWDAVERQMDFPSLEPPAGVEPFRPEGPVSIVDSIEESPRAVNRRWVGVLVALVALAGILTILLLTTR
jgi:hypothetical protein